MKKKKLSKLDTQKMKDNISKRKYVDSRGFFKIYYSKNETLKLKKDIEKSGLSVKEVFELGILQMNKKKVKKEERELNKLLVKRISNSKD